jgi:hypothetical protein
LRAVVFGLLALAPSCGPSSLDLGHNPSPAPAVAAVAPDGGGPFGVPAPPTPLADGGAAVEASWKWLNPRPTGSTLRAIWGVAATDVWVVGAASTVLHWDGQAWQSAYAGSIDDDFYAVYAATSDDVWIAGRDASGAGKLLRGRHGTWTTDTSFGGRLPYAIWGTAESDVWLVLDHGDVAHFDGARWTIIPAPAGAGTLRDVWGTGPTDAWVVGDAGRLAHFDGTVWIPVADLDMGSADKDYIGVWGSGTSDVWAVYQTASPSADKQGRTGFVHWDGASLRTVQEESSSCVWAGTGKLGTGQILDTHRAASSSRFQPEDAPLRRGRRVWGVRSDSAMAVAGIDQCPWYWDGTRWTIDAIVQLAGDEPYEPEGVALWGAAPEGLWLVDHSGRLLHHDASAKMVDRTTYPGAVPQARYTDVFSDVRDQLLHVVTIPGGAWATSGSRVLHFGPGGWTPVGNLFLAGATFNALFALSDTEAWAGAGTQLHHWDGGTWSVAELPASTSTLAYYIGIYAVWASGPRDVWVARGEDLLHFDGAGWSVFPVPALVPADTLENAPLFSGIGGTGPNDVWIAASAYDVPRSEQLLYHFDGAQLTLSTRSWLDEGAVAPSVWARAADDAWVTTSPTLHWDGHAWGAAPVPIPQNEVSLASTVWARGANDVWFLSMSTSNAPQPFTRIMHWDGQTARVSFESRPVLSAISGDATGTVWAVGNDGATVRLVLPPEPPTR